VIFIFRRNQIIYAHPEYTKPNASSELSARSNKLIKLGPYVLMAIFTLGLALPPSRNTFLWLLRENHPIEWLTFLSLLVAAILGYKHVLESKLLSQDRLTGLFFACFSSALFFVSMEEIAWGQSLLGYETPQFLAANRQGEATIHNLPGFQGKSEVFRLIFGLGGLIGFALSLFPAYRSISVPAVLLPLFALISIHAMVDVANDIKSLGAHIDYGMQRTSELVELYIGIGALLYVWLVTRKTKESEPSKIG